MKNRPYKIVMSRGEDIPIDADELEKVIEGIQKRQPVILRKGMFNPAFYISVVGDYKRWDEFKEEIKFKDNYAELYEIGPKQLNDIFADLREQLSNKVLRIEDGR